jgi:hypothetical protein
MTTTTSDIKKIAISSIHVPAGRKRKLQPEKVREFAESMRTREQLQPIIVRPGEGSGYELVAGWHRYEGAKKNRQAWILATVRDLTDDEAELIEIDENLIRVDLTPAERADHMARRKELYERLHPDVKQGGAPGKAGGGKKKGEGRQNGKLRFTKDTANKTGRSERSVQREVERGKNVVVLGEISGTCLDNGGELDALAKLPPDEQRALAARVKAGETVSAKAQLAQLDEQELEHKPRKTPGQHVITAGERKAQYAEDEQQNVAEANAAETNAGLVSPPLPAARKKAAIEEAPQKEIKHDVASIRKTLDVMVTLAESMVCCGTLAGVRFKAARDEFETDAAFNAWLAKNELGQADVVASFIAIKERPDSARDIMVPLGGNLVPLSEIFRRDGRPPPQPDAICCLTATPITWQEAIAILRNITTAMPGHGA